MADLSGNDEERAEAALIAAAGKILANDQRDVPADFIAGVFAYAAPEDLMRYDPRHLAGLAADAWSFLATRKPGTAKIRLATPGAVDGQELALARLGTDTVLEIVNDDMPFLVDSVLAELADLGIDVRFVVHPVFAVERDTCGRLTAFKGVAPATPGTLRESFIHRRRDR
jgi:glutamate dehydrogenase